MIFGRSPRFALFAIAMLAVVMLPDRCGGALSHAAQHAPADVPGAALPDAGEVVSAYLTARRWIDAFELPAIDDAAGRIHLSNATGVCVQLRRSGRVLGSGVITPSPQIDSDLKLRRALGRAMAQTLGDSAVAGLPEEMRGEVGGSLILELEIAGPPEPLIARSFQHVAQQIEPGVHGVALRRGNRWAMLFPSQLLATNGADRLAARLPLLVEEIGVSAADLQSLIEVHNVSVYRFHTSHLVQTAPDQLPHEAHRGDRLVMLRDVTVQSTTSAMDELARHLLRRAWPEHDEAARDLPEEVSIDRRPAMLGDYRPVADRYDPLVARPFDQALSAFALARYAALPDADESLAREAAKAAARILSSLHRRSEDGAADDDPRLNHPATRAAALYAVTQMSHVPEAFIREIVDTNESEELDAARERWADQLTEALLHELTRILSPDAEEHQQPRVDSHTAALMIGALARRLAVTDGQRTQRQGLATLREGLDALWHDVPPATTVSLLPWIGWAERDIASLTDSAVAHAERLMLLRTALYEAQVGESDDEQSGRLPADLHGGFLLAGNRRPDAQSIRPMIWLASMARDQELTDPDSLAAHEARLRSMIRFLMQLTVRESSIWSLRNPERALGGVRNAAWDSDQPLAAQAMALLAFCEAVTLLDAGPDAATR